MGSFGYYEDTHARHGCGPKLTVTGRLAGTLDGRPVEVQAAGHDIRVSVANLRAAWLLRRSVFGMMPVLRVAQAAGLGLRLSVASRTTVEVLPEPSFVLRLLVPALAKVTS